MRREREEEEGERGGGERRRRRKRKGGDKCRDECLVLILTDSSPLGKNFPFPYDAAKSCSQTCPLSAFAKWEGLRMRLPKPIPKQE